jgi:hypothetical protein
MSLQPLLQKHRGWGGYPDPVFGLSAGVDEGFRCRRRNYGAPGVGCLSTSAPRFASAVIRTTWRLYPLWRHSITRTSCHHGGVPSTFFLGWCDQIGSPFIFITIQNSFPATPFFSHRSKMPGVWGVLPDFCLSHKGGNPLTGNGAQPEIAVPRDGRPPRSAAAT